MGAPITAISRLDVGLGSTGVQKKTTDRRLYGDPVGRASERLTVSAVTNPNRGRVDFGLKGNLSAVTTPRLSWPSSPAQIPRPGIINHRYRSTSGLPRVAPDDLSDPKQR